MAVLVYVSEEEEGAVAAALQNQQNSNVKFEDVFSLRIGAVGLAFVLPGDEIVHLLEGVDGGLLAAVGHVLADAEVGLIGVDVGRVGGE